MDRERRRERNGTDLKRVEKREEFVLTSPRQTPTLVETIPSTSNRLEFFLVGKRIPRHCDVDLTRGLCFCDLETKIMRFDLFHLFFRETKLLPDLCLGA